MSEQSGKVLAAGRMRAAQSRAERLAAQLRRPATLAVVAPDDDANRRFVEIKRRAFRSAGMELIGLEVPPGGDTTAVLSHIGSLNIDAAVDGVFLQFPLPPGVDAQRCGDAIDPRKDIDAAGSFNLGRVLAGGAAYLPAAPAAALLLLEATLSGLRGRSVVVAGGEGVVERTLVVLGVARGATMCILEPDDPALADAAAGADAVVITDPLPPADAFRHVRSGAVLLDTGYYLPPRPADWLPPRTRDHLGAYLGQYGNVGPLTVALLMEAVLHAAARADPAAS